MELELAQAQREKVRTNLTSKKPGTSSLGIERIRNEKRILRTPKEVSTEYD